MGRFVLSGTKGLDFWQSFGVFSYMGVEKLKFRKARSLILLIICTILRL